MSGSGVTWGRTDRGLGARDQRRGAAARMREAISCVAWDRTGAHLALGCLDGIVHVLDIDRNGVASNGWTYRMGAAVLHLSWSATGVLAAGDLDGCVIISANAVALVKVPMRHLVTSLEWSPGGDRLAVGAGSDVVVCSADGSIVAEAPFLAGSTNALVWAHGPGDLAAAGLGGIWWLATTTTRDDPVVARYESEGSVLTARLDPSGARLASGDSTGILRIIDLVTGEEVALSGYPDRIEAVTWDRSGITLAVPADDEITIWFLAPSGIDPTGASPRCLHGHDATISVCEFLPQTDRLISGDVSGRVCIWDGRDQPVRTVELASEIMAASVHPIRPVAAVGTRDGAVDLVGT